MNKLTLPIALVAMITGVGSAFAAQATGTIASMDAMAHTVTLDDGQIYEVAADYDVSMMKAGEKVNVTFDISDGKNMATAVVVTE